MQLAELGDLRREDWRALYALYRDPELAGLNAATPVRMPLLMFKLTLLGEQGRERMGFGVFVGGQLVGNAELYSFAPARPAAPTRATLGVMLARSHWGQGYGTETLNALLAWAFGTLEDGPEPPLERIRLTTLAHNERALAAFARAGFEEKGRFQRGAYHEVNMELRREDWINRQHGGTPA